MGERSTLIVSLQKEITIALPTLVTSSLIKLNEIIGNVMEISK